jgi:hypothetical protein
MPDASDEQSWWSDLFTGGADPGLEIPDGVWESVMTTALDIDTADPADDLMPVDQPDTGSDGLDDEPGIYHDFGHPSAHDDTILHDDVGSIDPESVAHDPYDDSDHHGPYDHDGPYHTEALYDVAPGDSVVDNPLDSPDSIDDQL